MPTIFELYSDYQQKKWFREKYPDPLGELADYLNENAIRDLVQQSKTEKDHQLLQIANDLSKLLS
ncbi:MAG TPA: hypothetical protein VH815_02180, partial [Acidobacteriota bacterium]